MYPHGAAKSTSTGSVAASEQEIVVRVCIEVLCSPISGFVYYFLCILHKLKSRQDIKSEQNFFVCVL